MSERKTAFVTGASRGIGRAASIALAEAGYDIAMCARTTTEGKTADGRPLPGSLDSTEAEVTSRGTRALKLPMDLLDPQSVSNAIETTISEWGPVDLLLNNGIYTGPGNMDFFLDVPEETIETIFRANFLSQIQLIQRVLPEMLERKQGRIINMVSNAGLSDPPAPPTVEDGATRMRPAKRHCISLPTCPRSSRCSAQLHNKVASGWEAPRAME